MHGEVNGGCREEGGVLSWGDLAKTATNCKNDTRTLMSCKAIM